MILHNLLSRRSSSLVLLAVFCIAVSAARAADFRPGEKVEAKSGSEWKAATVVRPVGTERYTVKLEPSGDLLTVTATKSGSPRQGRLPSQR